jgi:nitroreductase
MVTMAVDTLAGAARSAAASAAPSAAPGAAVYACLEAAVAAPSIHNTQPWKFRLRGRAIDVFADFDRRLDAVDPRGRELLISVGAAVLNLRVAILAHGNQPLSRLFPSATEPHLVARVSPGPAVHPDHTVRALAQAIPRRRTNRRPFNGIPVPAGVLAELAAAAGAEGSTLVVADAVQRDWLLRLVHAADRRLAERPDYRAEIGRWTLADPARRDGIPPAALGPWSALELVPIRRFGPMRPGPRRPTVFEPEPTLVVLHTSGDRPDSWVRAGQALERVMLTATVRRLACTPLTSPLEIPELRELVADRRRGGTAQAILRIGYGPSSAPAPRRPVSEVMLH